MWELMGNAWRGWLEFTSNGKLCALFLASLVFLWVYYKRAEQKNVLIYGAMMTGFCIVPATATVLMVYQTKFYDYQWIWSMVPMTLVTAEAAVVLLAKCWPDFPGAGWKKGLPVALFLLGILGLSGGMGIGSGNSGQTWKPGADRESRIWAQETLALVKERFQGRDICLWAPREIMEYAREANPEILLPYGRNMWDTSLNGYAYDVYDENIVEMYLWMEGLEGTSLRASGNEAGAEDWTEGRMPEDRTPEGGEPEDPAPEAAAASGGSADTVYAPKVYGGYAVDAGVTCILLPEGTEQGILRELEKTLQVEARKLEGYWMLYGWTD